MVKKSSGRGWLILIENEGSPLDTLKMTRFASVLVALPVETCGVAHKGATTRHQGFEKIIPTNRKAIQKKDIYIYIYNI